MADVPVSNALSSGPRSQTVTLTASNGSIAIPSWAQGGKGLVYVTGCGGGAGGEAATNAGGAAASAVRHPLIIGPGATTMGVTIGNGGAVGNNGGNTDISIGGTNVLRLTGGQRITTPANPALWNTASSAWRELFYLAGTFNATLLHSFASWTLMRGLPNNAADGAPSPFGAGGTSVAATGYGAGGGVNAAGAPGFVILEFVEGI